MVKFGIVLVGPGLIGIKHIENITKRADAELLAIVAPISKENQSVASTYNVPHFEKLEDCISSIKVDGVIVSSPNKFHYQQAAVCVRAGIPVLIEKPITATYKEAVDLLGLVNTLNAKVLVGHHRAHSPILRQACEFIKSGALGDIVCMTGVATFYKPDHYFEDGPWRKDIGGGPILINLIHEIGNLRALCGEISAIQAVSSNKVRGYVVEDTVSINIEFVNGALGNFMLSDTAASARSWEQTSQENGAYSYYDDEDCYVISGTKGTISIPSMRVKFYEKDVDRSWWKPFSVKTIEVDRLDPLECQMQNFIEVISGKAMPVVTAYDGVQNLKITEAVIESSSKGVKIYIN